MKIHLIHEKCIPSVRFYPKVDEMVENITLYDSNGENIIGYDRCLVDMKIMI